FMCIRLFLFCLPPVSLFSHMPPLSAFFTLSLHDALPICTQSCAGCRHVHGHRGSRSISRLCTHSLEHSLMLGDCALGMRRVVNRSEEHTSELQSRFDLVCRLLLEKKNNHE